MSFDDAFALLIGNEGGYVNNPKDPGGETMYGVTARVARANGYSGAMRELPLDTAKRIAKSEYWDKYQCDSFDSRIGFELFDIAYNGGYAAKWLQTAVGVKADGKIGPQTIAAVQQTNPFVVVMRLCAYRISYYTSLNAWPTFGKGWANRVAGNLLQGSK